MSNIVKIFTVTKNETDLIDDFIHYHGSLFGFTNIVIIDNDSDCPTVLQLYDDFRRMGVVVEKYPSYRGNSQGKAFTKYMSKYRTECNFMVGLDTDEFLQFPDFLTMNLNRATSAQFLKNRFRAYFSNLSRDASKFNIVKYFESVPDTTNKCYSEQSMKRPAKNIVYFYPSTAKPKKCFFRSETFLSTVNGCHNGKTSSGREVASDLCYVHFHDTGARRSVERARNIVRGYAYADVDSDIKHQLSQLKEVVSPIGTHRVLEYALFLSKLLVLKELVNGGVWPRHPSYLHVMAMKFPSMFGVNVNRMGGVEKEQFLVNLPLHWANSFDSMILYDEPVSNISRPTFTCRLIQNLLSDDQTTVNTRKSAKRPKVALMLSGHLRNFGKRKTFWKNFVTEFPDVDIFVHTWSDGGVRGTKEWIDVGKNIQNHEIAKSILKPVDMVVENHEELFQSFSFRESGVDLYYTHFSKILTTDDFTRCIGSQLYSIKRCFELTQKSQTMYDVYVRLRGDAVVNNFGRLVNNSLQYITEDTVVMNGSNSHVHPGGGRGCKKCDTEYASGIRNHVFHSNDVCDIFYFGRLKAMSKLCNMYDSVKELVRSFQKENYKSSRNPAVKKFLHRVRGITTVTSPHVYENVIKCFYPERLIREFMKEFWLVSDTLGLVPEVSY